MQSISPQLKSKSSEQSGFVRPIDELEDAYTDASHELRSKQVSFGNYSSELDAFIKAQEAIKSHPEFDGSLPETYFTGSDLDPEPGFGVF